MPININKVVNNACSKHYTCPVSECFLHPRQHVGFWTFAFSSKLSYRTPSMDLDSCFAYKWTTRTLCVASIRSCLCSSLQPHTLSTTSPRIQRRIVHCGNKDATCDQMSFIPFTLHIIYPFPLLFVAHRLVVLYNKIDEGWRVRFCRVLLVKWHTPGSDREAQQELTRACLPYKEILAFDQRGLCPSLMTFSNTQAEYIVGLLRLRCQTSC